MNDLEVEIGRTLGASAFFVYQVVKENPNSTALDIQVETGLSETCVSTVLAKLRKAKVLEYKNIYKCKFSYKENKEKDKWEFH